MAMMFRALAASPYDPRIPGSGASSPPLTDQGTAPPYAPVDTAPMMFGTGSGVAPVAAPIAVPDAASAAKPGFNEAGGLGDQLQTLAGHLMLAGGNPGGAQAYLQPIEQRQQMAFGLQKQAQQQALETVRQYQIAQWKQAHPADDDFTRLMRAAGIDPNSPQGKAMYLKRTNTVAEGMNGIPQLMTIPGAGTFAVRRGASAPPSMPAASPTPPDEAIARLRSNPHEAAKFDEVFGAGASARYLNGGAASTASTPFPTR